MLFLPFVVGALRNEYGQPDLHRVSSSLPVSSTLGGGFRPQVVAQSSISRAASSTIADKGRHPGKSGCAISQP